MDRKKLQRLIIIVFGLAFIGSTGFAVFGSLLGRNASSNSRNLASTTTNAPSVTEQLQARARGYAKVLEREPNNTTALIGLLQTSLQIGDLQTAIAPLKKLIELYPERTDFTNLLAEIEKELAQQSPQTTTTESTEETAK